MKKSVGIIIPVLLVAVCVLAVFYFKFQTDDAYSITKNTTAVSTAETSKYQSYIDRNSDFAGYIKIDGTNIDYPVVQGEDNEFYLTHNFDKNEEEQ